VIEHGRLVGVVTRVDVLEALTRDETPAPDAA
jgi:CBS domain-containing protein